MLLSPLPTKCSLELIREQLVGGLISDDLLKKQSGIVTEGVISDGSKVAELLNSEGNGVTKENNGQSILDEISGEQLNQQPNTAEVDNHSVRIGDGDLNVQTAESIEDDAADVGVADNNQQPSTGKKELAVETGGGDLNVQGTESIEEDEEDDGLAVPMEIPDTNANNEAQSNTQQPSTGEKELAVEAGGGDLNLQETESIEEKEEEEDGDVVLMEIPDANANDGVQSNNQPSPVENGGGDNLQGTEPIPDDDGDGDVVLMDAHVANANGELDNSHQQPSTDGTEGIVKTSRANRDGEEILKGNKSAGGDHDDSVRKKSSNVDAKLDRPYANGVQRVISSGNKLTESNHGGSTSGKTPDADQTQNDQPSSNREMEHHHRVRSSNENGGSRKRKLNDVVEAGQSSVLVDEESKLCGRCHRAGALLECGSVNCPMMFHRECLGFDASSGEGRDFYCPLCAHSRAVAQLHEAQRRVALTQKNLTAFVDLSMRSSVNN
ncbi:hypothetical protein LINGRAHAP2_LOCUS27429 [Linum grandiflorum]